MSGTIGDAALGLRMRLEPASEWMATLDVAARTHLADRYLHPQPRLALAGAIRRFATAAMDVSDGLAGDLAKMLDEAGPRAEIDAARVPLSSPAAAAIGSSSDLYAVAVTGGDDYEILCTVAPDDLDAFRTAARAAGIPVTAIGTVVPGRGAPTFRFADGSSQVFAAGAFSHF